MSEMIITKTDENGVEWVGKSHYNKLKNKFRMYCKLSDDCGTCYHEVNSPDGAGVDCDIETCPILDGKDSDLV